jgi:hypothetical protein
MQIAQYEGERREMNVVGGIGYVEACAAERHPSLSSSMFQYT